MENILIIVLTRITIFFNFQFNHFLHYRLIYFNESKLIGTLSNRKFLYTQQNYKILKEKRFYKPMPKTNKIQGDECRNVRKWIRTFSQSYQNITFRNIK